MLMMNLLQRSTLLVIDQTTLVSAGSGKHRLWSIILRITRQGLQTSARSLSGQQPRRHRNTQVPVLLSLITPRSAGKYHGR